MENQRTAAPPPKPGIDPELQEMEAKNTIHALLDALKNSTVRRFQDVFRSGSPRKGIPTQGPKGEKSTRDRRRSQSPDRMARRAMAKRDAKPDPARSPHARLGRAKPFKSDQQKAMEYRSAVRSELLRIKLTKLLPECPEIRFVIGAGIRNAWQLSQASNEWIHSIPGMGPARRKKIYDYLVGKNVPVKWTPDARLVR